MTGQSVVDRSVSEEAFDGNSPLQFRRKECVTELGILAAVAWSGGTMRRLISIVAAASALALALGVSFSAKAASWHWITDQHEATQISHSYILGTRNAGNGNVFVEEQDGFGRWKRVGTPAGAGRSIGNNGIHNQPWVVTNGDLVFKLSNGVWGQKPNGNCEGGLLSVSKVLRNNNIAVGTGDNVFVIATDGQAAGGTNIRRFTGSCWEIMPGGGKGVEIGMTTSSSNTPWIRTAVGGLWAFNGTGWTQHQTAVVSHVGEGVVVGSDGKLIFSCSMGPPQTCPHNSTWNLGTINSIANGGFVIGPLNQVYGITFD